MDKTFMFTFNTDNAAAETRQRFMDLGLQVRGLAQPYEFAIMERANPEWDFDSSFIRALRFIANLPAGGGLVSLTVVYDD